MNVLLDEGGIYADINAIFSKEMDPLMNNSFVIGREEECCYGIRNIFAIAVLKRTDLGKS